MFIQIAGQLSYRLTQETGSIRTNTTEAVAGSPGEAFWQNKDREQRVTDSCRLEQRRLVVKAQVVSKPVASNPHLEKVWP